MTSDSLLLEANPYLSIRNTSYGGRGYFAKTDIPANTTVLTCNQPLTYVIFKPFKKEVCAYCFSYNNGKPRKFRLNSNLNGKNRPAYGGLYFCTEKCCNEWSQLYDYDGLLSLTLEKIELSYNKGNKSISTQHAESDYNYDVSNLNSIWEQIESEYLTRKQPPPATISLDDVEYDTARVVAFVLVQKYRVNNFTTKIPQEWDYFTQLQSNESSHVKQYPEFISAYINVYKFLRGILQDDLQPLCIPKLLRDTVGREAGNAFGIWELPMMMESECFGTAIYPSASFFNHECKPSVNKKRIDHSMIFTTARDISKDEQLFIRYGMMETLSYQERKTTLTEQWHFECQCKACLADKLSNILL